MAKRASLHRHFFPVLNGDQQKWRRASAFGSHCTSLSTVTTTFAAARGVLGSLERKIDDASGGTHEVRRARGDPQNRLVGNPTREAPQRHGFSLFMRFLNSNRVNMGN